MILTPAQIEAREARTAFMAGSQDAMRCSPSSPHRWTPHGDDYSRGFRSGMKMRGRFANIQGGLLPTGTVTPLGTIEQVSLTAYKIDGHWVSFQAVHGKPEMVEPLVRFQ